jgi:hypothetical protein
MVGWLHRASVWGNILWPSPESLGRDDHDDLQQNTYHHLFINFRDHNLSAFDHIYSFLASLSG